MLLTTLGQKREIGSKMSRYQAGKMAQVQASTEKPDDLSSISRISMGEGRELTIYKLS